MPRAASTPVPADLAAIYARVSKAVAARAQKSVRDQTAEARAACAQAGWTIGGEYVDDDRSASPYARKDRDDWARLVADLTAGRYGRLVIWEPSRGSRDLEVWAPLLATCRRLGVLVHVVSHERTYDPRIGRDWRTLAEDAVKAQADSDEIASRTRRGLASSARDGRPHARTPYGHLRRYDPATRAFLEQVPDPDTAPIVAEIIGRVARSEPLVRIAADLNGRGVPAPRGGTWSPTGVRQVARNPAHAARRVHEGHTYPAKCQALVSELVWLAAQRVLSDPARRAHSPGRVKWLMSRLAVCGVCGKPLYARPAAPARHTSGGHYLAAHGPQYLCPGGCVCVDAQMVHDVVYAVLPKALAKYPADRIAASDERVQAARAELAALEKRLDEHRDSAASPGGISAASLARIESRMLPQIAAAAERAKRAATPLALRELLAGKPTPEVIRRRLLALPLATQREIIRLSCVVSVVPATHRAVKQPERVLFSRWWGLD